MANAAATDLPTDIRLLNATALALGAFGAAALLATALAWFAQRPVFALRAIAIDGDLAHNSALTIRAHAAQRITGNFWTIDLARAKRAFESVPWVRRAVVERVWPNRLHVRLEEHRPVALWAGATERADAAERLVNSHGEVFDANLGDVEDDGLPTLRGPDGASATMLALLQRLQPEFAPMAARIEAVELSGRGSWRVELDGGAEIEIGRGTDDELLARTRRFVATLPDVRHRFEQHPLLYADLRHRDGYAVRLKGVSTGINAVAPVAKPTKKQRE